MNYPRLSVIMPVFNMQDYVLHCLLSILNQSYKNLELYIVDDGSTDDSVNIIRKFIKDYKNAHLEISDKNYGAGHARNIGLSLAKGDFVGFIDSDDWVDTDFYSVLIDTALKDDSDIVMSGITDEFDNKVSTKPRYVYKYDNCIDSRFALELLSRTLNRDIYITPIINNKIYRSDMINKHNLRFNDSSYYEDDIFTFWAINSSRKVSITSKTIYHYYQRNDSIRHSFSMKHIEDLFIAFSKLKCDLLTRDLQYELEYIFPAYLKKSMVSMLTFMFKTEQSKVKQKKYLKFFAEKLFRTFTLDELINYMDISSVKELFGGNL